MRIIIDGICIELDYVDEPSQEEIESCYKKHEFQCRGLARDRRSPTLINWNSFWDCIVWRCTGIWFSRLWGKWRSKLESYCNLNDKDFKRIVSYVDISAWMKKEITWNDLLNRIIEELNKHCGKKLCLKRKPSVLPAI